MPNLAGTSEGRDEDLQIWRVVLRFFQLDLIVSATLKHASLVFTSPRRSYFRDEQQRCRMSRRVLNGRGRSGVDSRMPTAQ